MVAAQLSDIFIVRHGETAWTLSGQHTSFTDLGLTQNGREQAMRLAGKLKGKFFAKVFCSPLRRAMETCGICDLLDSAEILDDLREWNYGQYEGLKTVEIRQKNPNWLLFKDGAPGGESPTAVMQRADRVIEKISALNGDVAVFSSGHFIRALAARWIGLDVVSGKNFLLSTASLGILSHDREIPAIKLWNDVSHLD